MTRTYGLKLWQNQLFSVIVKLFGHFFICTDRGFQCDGPAVEKALDPVVDFIQGTTELFEFVERKYFEYFGRVSKLKLCRLVIF